jgi:hypothetical protein
LFCARPDVPAKTNKILSKVQIFFMVYHLVIGKSNNISR